ncbi:MAG: DUF2459 domain-containing protein [Hyphomicrobiales bacterium]|nr:DUF2459 domain-containing protein [Hyphomicrobiales bacterium]
MRRALRWTVGSLSGIAAVLVLATLITARPGDPTLYPPGADSAGVTVHIAANLHHSGLILPRAALADAAARRRLAAVAEVAARFARFDLLEFGWGDEAFYTRVPTKRELTVALALRALFRPGNATVLHVVGLDRHPRVAYPEASLTAVTLSARGFDELAQALDASFARSGRDGAIEVLRAGLYGPSAFYRARGTFNLFRVCNHWTADLLDAAGVPTTPVLATLPQGLLWDLSMRAKAQPVPPLAR